MFWLTILIIPCKLFETELVNCILVFLPWDLVRSPMEARTLEHDIVMLIKVDIHVRTLASYYLLKIVKLSTIEELKRSYILKNTMMLIPYMSYTQEIRSMYCNYSIYLNPSNKGDVYLTGCLGSASIGKRPLTMSDCLACKKSNNKWVTYHQISAQSTNKQKTKLNGYMFMSIS